MAVERKRAGRRHDQNSSADKLLLGIEQYRELAFELAPVAVGLLDKTIEILREAPVKNRRIGGLRRPVELGLKAKR